MNYLFLLGRTPRLGLLELQTIIPNVVPLPPGAALLSGEDRSFSPQRALEVLGGTTKIAKVIGAHEAISPVELGKYLSRRGRRNRIVFGVSSYDQTMTVTGKFLSEIKKYLERSGYSARFVETKHLESLSSVVVKKQAVVELVIVRKNEQYLVSETVAVQPFEEWNRRDWGRPFADPKAGMLPPKVARMVVNIAVGSASLAEPLVLLDPFCGMGTILAEGLLRGCRLIGSDQSKEVVEKARKNLEYIASIYRSVNEKNWTLLVSDATHVSRCIEPGSVNAIVTEPFLGTTQEADRGISANQSKVRNIVKGLEKLYIGCLRDWQTVLTPNGKVVIALPEYAIGGRTYFVKKVIDNCETLGYTVVTGPIEYSRPQAVVRRQFFVLQKKN